MEREIVILEPDDFQMGRPNATRVEARIVDAHQSIRCERGLVLDSIEALVSSQPVNNTVESIEIDRRTATVVGNPRPAAPIGHTAVRSSAESPDPDVSAGSMRAIRRRVVFHAETSSQTASTERSVVDACAAIETAFGDSTPNISA